MWPRILIRKPAVINEKETAKSLKRNSFVR